MPVLRNVLRSTAVVLLDTVLLVGCGGETATQSAADVQTSENWKAGLDDDVVVSLANLSEEDRRSALAQKECPVTGKQLGSMNTPVKISVQGEEVFLCCAGCEATILESPGEYLVKLRN